MRRFAALFVCLALALACAGGVAMSEAAPTPPPLRHILDLSFSVSPSELVEPGEVTLTFTVANNSLYDAQNVYISSSDGLHSEPLGQIDAGDSRVFNRTHTVTEAELDAGYITYIFSHDGIAGDPDTVNYTVDCPIARAIARPEVEFTRQLTATYARPGDVVTITYRVQNTGNVPIANLRVDDAAGEYTGRADALEVGQSRIFTSKITIDDVTTSEPRLRYSVPSEGDVEYEVRLESARILLADEQLTCSLALDRESARIGETVTATLTVMSLGNVAFYDVAVFDETYGGRIADALSIGAGTQTLTVTHEYPVRGDASYQMRVRALSSSGATIEVVTEPVSLRALDAPEADVSLYAEAVYPQIAQAGDAPVDVYIANAGGDAREAVLSLSATGETLHTFSFLAGDYTTCRRVYVPVSQSGEFAFSLSYVDQSGASHALESAPVRIDIAAGGAQLDAAPEGEPYTGESVKLSDDPSFLFLLLGACALLVGLAVALFLTSRRQKRARREKLAQQRRQRQEELGKTNRFTPVKRGGREKREKDGAP